MSTFDKYKELNANLKLEGGKPKFNLTYKDAPIRLQTPPFYVPFGLKQFPGKFNNVNCTLDLSLRGYEEPNKKAHQFLKWYREFESALFEQSLNNPDQFNSCIKQPNAEYPPLLRIKTPVEDGKIEASIWKDKKEYCEDVYGNINGAFKGHTAIGIINPAPYVLPNGMWGISWKLEQLRIFEPKRLRGCLFQD